MPQIEYTLALHMHILSLGTNHVFYVAAKPGKTLSITETLFPGLSSNFPRNTLLNLTFNCATKQLDVHIQNK